MTPYDPKQIAREAALNCAWALDIFVPHDQDDAPELQACTKIILAAAARMLRESGAREALEELVRVWNSRADTLDEMASNCDLSDNEEMRRLANKAGVNRYCANDLHAALANLAKLEGRG